LGGSSYGTSFTIPCSSQVSILVGMKSNKAGDMHSWMMVVVVVVVMVVPNPRNYSASVVPPEHGLHSKPST
jgi:hypothetical protein